MDPSSECTNRPTTIHKSHNGQAYSTTLQVPKITPFFGIGDPKAHLKTIRAQILISGGTNSVKCKMFVGTFTGTTL